ncbi:MAG: V-type ATP synthase subunit I [Thermoplasmata archaeon]|nr:MAG: V-type ATP synthase subunit I [Thermoplasmata archaeon]
MLYPERMKEVSIIVHDDYVERLVDGLHESGLIEIVDVGKSGRDFAKLLSQSKAHKIASQCGDLELQLNKLIEVLEKAEEGGEIGLGETIKEFLSPGLPPKYTVKPKSIHEVIKNAQELLFALETNITEIERKLEEISEERATLAEHEKQISMLAPLDIRLEYLGVSKYLIVKAGTTTDEQRLSSSVSKVRDSLIFTHQIEKKLYSAVVAAHIDEKDALESSLKGVFSSFSLQDYKGNPQEALDEIQKRTKEITEKRKALWEELIELRKKHLKDLIIIREEIGIFKARGEAQTKFGRTKETSVVTGWTPERHLEELERVVDKETDGLSFLYSNDPQNSEEIPIYRRNPRWAKPFEMLTEMFALPYHHEVDPTLILGPIFVIFFGLMLGDAVYGALVLLTGLLLYRGQGKVSKSMYDMGVILAWIGFSGVIFGIIQGSYLGPLTSDNPLTPALYSGEIGGVTYNGIGANHIIVLDSMNNPIPLLVLALIIGLIHLNMGLILAVWQNARRKAYGDILYSQVSWFLLQYAGVVVFGGFFGWFTFPMLIKIPAYICGIIGLILVFLQFGEESPEGKRKRKGPLGFFDLTGFIGNWLSYARILALGLATAGIAMTINIIATLIKDVFSAITAPVCAALFLVGIVLIAVGFQKQNNAIKGISILLLLMGIFGAIGAIAVSIALILLIIFIFGHIINAVLQALGGFIHALRLHYVEFFGQFYSGGGKKFSPFVAEREHTVIEKTEKGYVEVPK